MDIYKEIGKRIREERKARGLTLENLSRRAGYTNYQTLLNIENGERRITIADLYAISKALGLSVDYFLEEQEESHVLWRKCLNVQKCKKFESLLKRYCKNYAHLLDITGATVKKFKPYSTVSLKRDYPISSYEFPEKFAEEIRKEYNLSSFPGKILLQTLENNGILIFLFNLGKSGSSACFVDEFGGAILLNSAEVQSIPWRMTFNLAHEFFHLLTWDLYNPEEIYDNEEKGKSIVEKFADAFAAHLLIPESVLMEEIGDPEKIDNFDIAYLAANVFRVSPDALIWRLYNLKLIDEKRKENLLNSRKLKILFKNLWKKEYGKTDKVFKEIEELPDNYISLALKAFRLNLISKMKLAEFLGRNIAEVDYLLFKLEKE